MNIKNLIIIFTLLSSTNLFCMNMETESDDKIEMEEEVEIFETPIQLFENFGLLSEQEFNNLIFNELKKGNVNLIDSRGCHAFVHAIRENYKNGNYKYAVQLLLAKSDYLNIPIQDRSDVLLNAISGNEINVVKWLIELGTDLNQIDSNITALILAVRCDRNEIVRLLINAGADLNIQNEDGITALIQAAMLISATNNQIKNIELLINNGADTTLRYEDDDGTILNYIAVACSDGPDKEKIRDCIKAQKEKVKGKLLEFIPVKPLCGIVADYCFEL